jgi:hypothetical protein
MLRAALIATTVLILGSASADRTHAQCLGDCDADGEVAVAEIVSGVAIALDRRPLSDCAVLDADANQIVSIFELSSAVGFALIGCPPAPTPTATVSCGDPSVTARFGDCVRSTTQADCENAGGEWGRYPFSGMEGCFCPTGQDGCPCDSADDCLSYCSAGIPGGFDACATVQMGTCDAVTPIGACFCTPSFSPDRQGFSALCVDP